MKVNLKSFLGQYNVEIPMLQRDYAQGRKSKENIAKDFLEKIFEVLKGESKKLHIDFIYGYEENNKFILVDGQQRITTLWLIHFIIYKMNDIFDNNIKNLLNKFSYSVRESSKIFCKNLIEEELNLDGKPKDIILKKAGLFVDNTEDLKNDPTIKAMLNMLNLIYSEAKELNQNELKNAADYLDNITFSIFDMGEYELGEELYIKMNARGKQLSKYENVKAYIQKGLNFEENFKLFSSIDNEWSDFFFDAKNIDNFDNRGLIFLYYSALFFHFNKEKEIKDNKLDDYLNKKVLEDSIDYKFFDILKASKKLQILDNTIKILNKYKKEEKPLNKLVEKFNSDLSRKDICYFCSLLSFIYKIKDTDSFDKNAFDDYYRVCKHFIENYWFDKNDQVKNFFELSNNRLSEGYNDIYKYLSEDNKKAPNFHTEIYKLEKQKAELIVKSRENKNSKDNKENWEEILNNTSDNDFLVGWVDFLLYFSDNNFDKFKKYAELTIYITNKLKDTEFLNLFQRALLTFGDYGFVSTNYFYGNIPQKNIFRDRQAWIRILSGTDKDGNIINECFKELLDNLLNQNNGTLDDKLKSIIDNANFKDKKWFEYLLIKEPQLFDFINKKGGNFQKCGRIKYFDRRGDKDMLLLQTVKTKRDSVDLLTYSFYIYTTKKVKIPKINYKKVDYDKHGDKRNKNSYFSINNKEVICDSINEIIQIGNKKYDIKLHKKGTDIFKEFDNILKESNIIK